ncbi:hypothetical protein SAMCCGM7_pC2039 (plasmid) [Sinorhizobium americanum CCGM7]|nr:hypothetical protein SAMCCGM7_pC2039 [Sinorhizobium americanum CCGM7]
MLAFLLEIGTRLVTPDIFHDAYSFSGDGWESGDVAHQYDSAEIGDVESAFEVVEKEAGIDHLSNAAWGRPSDRRCGSGSRRFRSAQGS